ncbi:MAG: response regulator [Chloroflexota bacterium]
MPGPTTVQFGGNTSCVQMSTRDALIVLDCGTGARALGKALMAQRRAPLVGHLLLSHTHWDHIQGFPFFQPLLTAGNHFTIYGASEPGTTLRDVLSGQMAYPYFPLGLAQLQSPAVYREIGEERLQIGDVSVTSQFLNHTTLTLGYRLECEGATVVYATDTEPFGSYGRQPGEDRCAFAHDGDRRFAAFVEGADVLIHDAQYTAAEYPGKIGWGHSPVEYAVEIALAAHVRHLVLFHHDVDRTDAQVSDLVHAARATVQRRGGSLQVSAAAEGLELDVARTGVAPEPEDVRFSVLVAEDDPAIAALVADTLGELNGCRVCLAADGTEALELAREVQPDLLLLDIVMPGLDGYELTQRIRADEKLKFVPVIILTGQASEATEAEGFHLGITDFMRKPFAPAQLKARVQMWLERQLETRSLGRVPTPAP